MQGQEEPAPTLAPGVVCFTCGLVETNPHTDKVGIYNRELTIERGVDVLLNSTDQSNMNKHICIESSYRSWNSFIAIVPAQSRVV